MVFGFTEIHVGPEICAFRRRNQLLTEGNRTGEEGRRGNENKSGNPGRNGYSRVIHGRETVAVRFSFPHPTSAPRIACRMDFQMT